MEAKREPTVTVYGAGIAGLTVAHELAERGFRVRVVEPDRGLDRQGRTAMAVGGVARTQYAVPGTDPGAHPWAPRRARSDVRPPRGPQLNKSPETRSQPVHFEDDRDTLTAEERARVAEWLEWTLTRMPSVSRVWIPGLEVQERDKRSLAHRRARAIHELFTRTFDKVFPLHETTSPAPRPLILDRPPDPTPRPTEEKPGARKEGPGQKEARAPARVTLSFAEATEPFRGLNVFVKGLLECLSHVDEISIVACAHNEHSIHGRPPTQHATLLAERRLVDVKRALFSRLHEAGALSSEVSFRVKGTVESPAATAPADCVIVSAKLRAKKETGALAATQDVPRIELHFDPLPEGGKTFLEATSEEAARRIVERNTALEAAGLMASFAIAPSTKNTGADTWLSETMAKALDGGVRAPLVAGSPVELPDAEDRFAGQLRIEEPEELALVTAEFKQGTKDLRDEERTLRKCLGRLDLDGSYRITITAYVDEEWERVTPSLSLERARHVEARLRAALQERLEAESKRRAAKRPPPRLRVVFMTRGLGPRERVPRYPKGLSDRLERGCVALIEIGRIVLPGEHGFRFFPSYYNHVFDTMRRTPLLDENGDETGRTVFDNVIPTPNQGIAQVGLSPLILPRSPPESAHERGERASTMRNLGYTTLDVVQFALRTLRYMCTCSERRAAELEAISWWEYLQGYDRSSGTCRFKYSARFERDVTTQSRTLASFDAVWGDARTCGNTWVQLFYNWLKPTAKVDGTLNAPTTEAWLEPWKRYLDMHLGVELVAGKLLEIKHQGGKLVPIVRFLDEDGSRPSDRPDDDEEMDYYVVATDAKTAEEVTRSLRQPAGEEYRSPGREEDRTSGYVDVPMGLDGFTTRVRPEPPNEGPGRRREPEGKYGLEKWDRFQTMSGIQFFFEEDFKLNDGYVYFNRAPWALTSIHSAQFWQRRPTLRRDGYASVMSIDLCDWITRADGGDVIGRSAWECTAPEIAKEVWRQILAELSGHPAPAGSEPRRREQWPVGLPPEPDWFHLDSNIELGRAGAGGDRPVRNKTPYLVPIKGDWHNRPGANPWDPTPSAFNLPPDYPGARNPSGDVWQAEHGGYLVHRGKLVFAGVYLKTFTRMSTMEAANESGRHAANAILAHHLSTKPGAWAAAANGDKRRRRTDDDVEPVNEGRHMRSTAFFRATPMGDFCAIWNPEHWEMPELVKAKQVDEWCFDRGLPHPWDVWGVEKALSHLSKSVNARTSNGPADKLGASIPDALEAALEPLLRLAYPDGGWQSVLQVVRRLRRQIDNEANRAAAGERGEVTPGDRRRPTGPNRR